MTRTMAFAALLMTTSFIVVLFLLGSHAEQLQQEKGNMITGAAIGSALPGMTTIAVVPDTGSGSALTIQADVSTCGTLTESATLTTNVNSNQTCFTIGAHHIAIDCQGFYINYSIQGKVGYGINNSDGYDNITIKNCYIMNGNVSTASATSRHNVYLSGSDNSTIYNTTFHNQRSSSYGIYAINSIRFNVTENTFFSSGSTAHTLILESTNNSWVMSNNFTAKASSRGVNLQTNAGRNTILFNKMETDGAGISVDISSHDNNLSNNNITLPSGASGTSGVIILSQNNILELSNVTVLDASNGVFLGGTNNTIISNKIRTTGSGGEGIAGDDDSWHVISYNDIQTSGSSAKGIQFGSVGNPSKNVWISFNNITTSHATAAYGVFVTDASKNFTITSNLITTTGGGTSYGIYIDDADFSNITNNNITVTNTQAIRLEGTAHGSTLRNNNISATALYEIYDETGENYNNSLEFSNPFGGIQWFNNGSKGIYQNLTINTSNGLGFGLDRNIFIGNDTFAINLSSFETKPRINSSANITFYSLAIPNVSHIYRVQNYTSNRSEIQAAGIDCLGDGTCIILNYSGGTLIFNTTFLGSFSVDDAPPLFSSALNTSLNFFRYENFTASLLITDRNLSAYIFSTNASGSLQNRTVILSGERSVNASQQANITETKGTGVCWYYWANDTNKNNDTSTIFCFTVLNSRPVFNETLLQRTATATLAFTTKVNCSDVDDDTITYYDNTSLFDVDSSTGIISDTPAEAEFGNYTINISCSDGEVNTSQTFRYTINDAAAPRFSSYLNTSIAFRRYENITSSVLLNDANLSAYIFSTNASGTLTNRTFRLSREASFNATAQANLSVTKGTGVCWFFYSNDSSKNVNQSDISCFAVVNSIPVFNETIPAKTVSSLFTLDTKANCSDVDDDTITYYDNTTLFDINSATGLITDSPTEYEAGTHHINLTCGDGEQNNSQRFLYTVTDDTAPQFRNASNTSLEFKRYQNFTASINLYDANLSAYILSTNASGTLTNRTFFLAGQANVNVSEQANITVAKGTGVCWLYYANDSGNNRNQSSITCFTVVNSRPVFNETLPQRTATATLAFSTKVNCSDVDDDTITYYDNTSLFDVDSSTGTISDTPTEAEFGNYTINISCSDGEVNTSQTFRYTINDAAAPRFSSYLNTSIAFQRYENITSSVLLNDANLSAYIFSTNASGTLTNRTFQLSGEASFNATAQANVTVTKGAGVCWSFYANDSSKNLNQSDIQCFTVVNSRPVFNETVTMQTVNLGESLSLRINCSDVDDDTITYYDNTSLFDIDSSTGQISDTPLETEKAVYTINISCSDGEANTSQTFLYNVTDTIAPSFRNASHTGLNFRRYENFTASINLYDANLSSYTLSTNASGTLTNRTFFLAGQANVNVSEQANITVAKGTGVCWLYYANDSGNNRNQSSITCFTVVNSRPVFNETLPNRSSTAGIAFSTKVNCSDIDDDTITYYDNTSLFDVDSSTGIITDTPAESEFGNYTINISCSDGDVNTSQTFLYTINDAAAPRFSSYLNTSLSFRRYENITASILLADANLSAYILSTNASGTLANRTFRLSGEANFNATAQANLTVTKGTGVCWYYYANDSSKNLNQSDIQCFTVVNSRPAFNETLPNRSLTAGIAFSTKVNCSDVDDDTITYYDNTSLFDVDSSTGTISDTPAESEFGNYTINISCSDGEVNTSQTFLYTINDAAAPRFSSYLNTSLSFRRYENITASILLADANLSAYILSTNASGTLANRTFRLSGEASFNATAQANLTVTKGTGVCWYYYANDSSKNLNQSDIQCFTVVNSRPVFNETVTMQTVNLGESLSLRINCSDVDEDTISYYDNTSLFNIDSSTGQISDTPLEAERAVYTINISCSDGEVNSSQTFQYNITDSIAPQFRNASNTSLNFRRYENFTALINIYDVNLSAYILSTNASGTLINRTFRLSGQANVNVSEQANITVAKGIGVCWFYYANDSNNNSNNINQSDIQCFTVVNSKPVFNETFIDKTAPYNNLFQFRINCSDIDDDTITYYDNTSLFDIDATSGLINKTPSQSDIGTYTINISCFDGEVNSSQTFTYRVTDTTPPNFTLASNLSVGFQRYQNFTANITITDQALDYYIFATNASGSWVNITKDISSEQFNASHPANISPAKNSNVCWYYWANDTSSNTENSTLYCFSVVNTRPAIETKIEDQSVAVTRQLDYDIDCSDNDGDNITYYDNATLFNISSSTGTMTHTPATADIGSYTINVSCSDGEINTSATFLYTIRAAPVAEAAPSAGGAAGGGGSLPPEKPECLTNADCPAEKYCLSGKCLKIFDLKIIQFDSPAQRGEFFDLSYLIKGMADISGDVIMQFRIERDGVPVAAGADVIFVGNFEEKVESASLFLPNELEDGEYVLYVKLSFQGYEIESFRTIEVVTEAPMTVQLSIVDLPEIQEDQPWRFTTIIGVNKDEPQQAVVKRKITQRGSTVWVQSEEVNVNRSAVINDDVDGLNAGQYVLEVTATIGGLVKTTTKEFTVISQEGGKQALFGKAIVGGAFSGRDLSTLWIGIIFSIAILSGGIYVMLRRPKPLKDIDPLATWLEQMLAMKATQHDIDQALSGTDWTAKDVALAYQRIVAQQALQAASGMSEKQLEVVRELVRKQVEQGTVRRKIIAGLVGTGLPGKETEEYVHTFI